MVGPADWATDLSIWEDVREARLMAEEAEMQRTSFEDARAAALKMAAKGPITSADLGDKIGVQRPRATTILGRLEKAGELVRVGIGDDRSLRFGLPGSAPPMALPRAPSADAPLAIGADNWQTVLETIAWLEARPVAELAADLVELYRQRRASR